MAIYVSLPNQKGGVGKTTLDLHLAWRLQELGLRVLAVDFDPQGNFSESLLGVQVLDDLEVEDNALYAKIEQGEVAGAYARRSYHLLSAELIAPLKPVPTRFEGLDVLPSLIDDTSLQAVNKQPIADAVNARINLALIDKDYDVVVIDVPPQKDTLHLAGVIASNKIVLPVMMSAYPMRGIRAMMHTLDDLEEIGVHVELIGVLVNIFNSRSSTHQEGIRLLQEKLGPLLLKHKIGYRTSLDTSVGDMHPVWKVSSGAARDAAEQVRGAMDEIIAKCGFERQLKEQLSRELKQRQQRANARKPKAVKGKATKGKASPKKKGVSND